MSEELNKPMPHAERQALIERLRAEGVEVPDDVKNHVVNGGASAQKMLSAHTQLGFAEEVRASTPAGRSAFHAAADVVWWTVAVPAVVFGVIIGLLVF